ncbi:uncharacterized protein LOC126670230 [Mercurialis annua]|uniref:uncharacterized protein LOC126670230 n=1 Tax=Mercurialis annua TaxID=3986 RepID=UPI002160EE24|nr:uncharacterized protein LOC126670230 [Mercurialis annua]
MAWSPQAAMKAYLHTLQLSDQNEEETPKSMEFIAASAAGKQAKLMVEITTQGITPYTITLAVAAKHTGGTLICILPHQHHFNKFKTQLKDHHQHLKDVIQFVCGNPYQLVMDYKKIDFIVVDGKLKDRLKLVKMVNLNPSGCIIVEHSLNYRKNVSISLGQILKAKHGVGIVSLAIGEGIEFTKIESSHRYKRYTRFHVTFEN